MFVCTDLRAEVPDTNAHSFGLEKHHDEESFDNLYYGYDATVLAYRSGNRQVMINQWAPTEFAQVKDHHGLTPLEHSASSTEVYSICPYTVDWLNKVDSPKYKYIFYPFNKKDIPFATEKEYDVCYFGGIHSVMHQECMAVMRLFKYCYMTMDHGIGPLTQAYLPMATHINLSHREKIVQVGKCKVSVCYHIVPLYEFHIKNIKSYPEWEKNEAFSRLDQAILPQFKSRMHEAAMARTLNLVYRDPWGISEDYYTPDVDFVYFDSNEELEEKLQHILNNWEDYEKMIENAYNKALNYTTDRMFDVIKKGKLWKPKNADRADLIA
jgi:hypothetical protein